MAIAYDNSAKGSSAVNVDNVSSASFAVGSGSDRVLVAGVLSGAGTPVDPTSVKWGGSGGTAMTKHGSTLDLGSNVKISLWRLIAPTTQSSTVHVLWPSAQDEKAVVAAAYTGVDQTTPLRAGATNTASSSDTCSATATSVSSDLVVALYAWLDLGGTSITAAVGAGQTSRQEVEGADLVSEGLLFSEKSATTTTTAMSGTNDGSNVADFLGVIAAALIPAGGGGGGSTPAPNLLLLGVG